MALLMTQCESPRKLELWVKQSEYAFDPSTIQQAIRNREGDIFDLVWTFETGPTYPTRPPVPAPLPNRQAVAWTEADFEQIIHAFTEVTGREAVESWDVADMVFRTSSCRDASAGPQIMTFTFYKTVPSQRRQHYLEKLVTVDTETGRLNWLEAEVAEVGRDYQPLDRALDYITADAALRAAERAGGAEFRANHGDNCQILGILYAGLADSEWQIQYEAADGTLELQINKETGIAQVIRTPGPARR